MKSKRTVETSARHISDAQVSSILRPSPVNPLPNIKNKLGLLEEFRFILGTVNLESMGINPSLLCRAVLNNKIEQFYDETFKQILKGRSASAIDPGKALSQIFNRAPSANQIQFWQSVCNFLYTAAKFSENREVGLFILFLKAGNTSRAFQLYLCLRQYFKLITLIDPTKEKDITATSTSSENIIRIVDKAYSSEAVEYDQILDHLNNVFDCQKQIGYLEFLENTILIECPKSLEFMVSDLLNFYHSVSEKEPAKNREQSPGFTRKPFVLKDFDLEPPKNAFSKRSKSPITYIVRVKTKDKDKSQTKPISGTHTLDLKKPKKVSTRQIANQRVKIQPKSGKIQALFHTIDRTYNNKYRGGGIDITRESTKKIQQEMDEADDAHQKVIEENQDRLSEDELDAGEIAWDDSSEIRPKTLLQNKAKRESEVFSSSKNQLIQIYDAEYEDSDDEKQFHDDSVDVQVNQDNASINPGGRCDIDKRNPSERLANRKVINGSSNLSSNPNVSNEGIDKRANASNVHENRRRPSHEGLNDISSDPRARDSIPSKSHNIRSIGLDGSKKRSYAVEQIWNNTQSQKLLDYEQQPRYRPGGRSLNLLRLADDYPRFEVPQSVKVESERIIDNDTVYDINHKNSSRRFQEQQTESLRQSSKDKSVQEADNFQMPLLSVDLQESGLVAPDFQTPLVRESIKHMRVHSLYGEREPEALFDISHSENNSVLKPHDESDPNVLFNYSHTYDRRVTPNKSSSEIPDQSENLGRISPISNNSRQKDEHSSEPMTDKRSDLHRRNVQKEFEELINYSMDVDQLALSFDNNDNSYQIFDPTLKSHDVSFPGLDERAKINN